MTRDEFRQQLRELMRARGLSLGDIAKAAGVSRKTAWAWTVEHGGGGGPLHPRQAWGAILIGLGDTPEPEPTMATSGTSLATSSPAHAREEDDFVETEAFRFLRRIYRRSLIDTKVRRLWNAYLENLRATIDIAPTLQESEVAEDKPEKPADVVPLPRSQKRPRPP